ncbi:hypothetical protein [Streptomyces sp. NBC_01546]|uniref:hypothetical protein n=1 Tax=Streptomyces sp. NBC_01546 TaxID=2975872 RepID=UPI00386C1D30
MAVSDEVTLAVGAMGFASAVTGQVLLFLNGRRNTDKQIRAAETHLGKQLAAADTQLGKQLAAADTHLQKTLDAEEKHVALRAETELDRQIKVDGWSRNAAWHMHKRAVYSDLLEAAQELSDGPTDDSRRKWSKERARALIIAERPLRDYLTELAFPLSPSQLDDLVTMMREDVHPPKKKDPDDKKAEDQQKQAEDRTDRDGG